jgi:WD40 repeat protein
MNGYAYNMELANVDLKSSLLSEGHQQSYQQHQKLVRTYEEILESELNRANPILKGHTNAVTGIALTSDDSFLISCGKDNTLRIWSLIDRVQEKKYDIEVDPNSEISSMVLSPDNKYVILVVSEKYLLIRTLDTVPTTTKVAGKENVTIKSVAISNDSQQFCTADSEKTVKVYDLKGNVVKSHTVEDSDVNFVLFANKVVLIGETSGKIRGWNTLTSAFDYTLEHTDQPTAGVLYENNRCLAAAYSNGEVIIWNLLDKNQEFHFNTEHSATPNGISYSSNSENKTIVFINSSREVIFVDVIAKNVKRSFVRHSETITGVLQTHDGRLVITASHDKLIKIWQQGEFREYKASPKFGKNIKCSALYKNSDLIAIAYNDTSVKIINLAEDRERLNLAWKGQSVYSAIWSHDKKQLITSNSTPEISVFSYEGKSVEFVIPCESTMTCLVLSPDSKLLYGCSGGNKIVAWNYQERTINHEYMCEDSSYHYAIAFSPDWTKMYSGGESIINIWDLASKTVEAKLEGNTSSVKCLVSLSNGKTLISGGNDGKVNFWNLEEKKLDVSIEEGYAWARAMDLFNEEKFLVIVHDTSKITVVNVEEKKIEYEFDVGSQYSCKVLNDTTLIMGDSDSIRFYNLAEKKEEAVIKAHSGYIYSLLIDKDNDTLISFSSDRSIKRWKISDKSQNGNYQTYCGTIKTLCLTSDYLGIATEEGAVLIYSNSSASEIKSLPVHNSAIQSLDYYSGNFATGSNDRRVGLFDMNEYKIHYFEGHEDYVRCVRFSNDGKLVFSASDDRRIKAWNVDKKTLDYTLEGHDGYVYSLCVFPSGKFIASGSGDKQVKVWDLGLRKEESSFENHSSNVNALCLSENEEILFSGSDDYSIAAVDVNSKKLICSMTGHSSSITNLALHNNVLFSTTSDEIKNWLINEKKEIFSFRWRTDCPSYLALSPDENYLAGSFSEGAVRIYDFKQGKFLETFQPLGSSAPRLAFTEDSKSLLLAVQNSNIIVWDIEHKQGHELPGTNTCSRYVKFSPDFSLIATFSDDNKAIVWNWTEKKILHTLEGHSSYSQAMIFSPDNKFLFVGTDDGAVFKWNLETSENHQFKDHGSSVKGLAISPSRNLLISGAHDKKVCFYDLQKNELIKSEEKHNDWIRTMAITKDEKFVISAGDDKVLVIWDLDTKEESFRMEGHSNYIYDIAVSSDNNRIFSGAGDKCILHWSLHQKKKIGNLRAVSGSNSHH